jgi:disulfide bond formation protein DsbB
MGVLNAIPRRWFNLAGFLACGGLLAFAYYLQFFRDLEPCPLCILQRVAFLVLGMLFLVAAIHNPGRAGSRVYGLLIMLAGSGGIGTAVRHLWLQNLPPDHVPDCGPGLGYMLEVFPLTETLRMVFSGAGECAEVVWSLLGISVPGWALVCFVILTGVGVVRNFAR